MLLEMCHLLFYFILTLTFRKNMRKHAQIWHGPTHDAGSVMRISFKYKLTGF